MKTADAQSKDAATRSESGLPNADASKRLKSASEIQSESALHVMQRLSHIFQTDHGLRSLLSVK